MRLVVILTLSLLSNLTFSEETNLSMFENLVSKTWKAEGKWSNGSKFIQEVTFKYSLNKTLVIADSIGYQDNNQSKLGPRNHGIRQLDRTTKEVKFWEFDISGGLTTGSVFAQGKNIIYQYNYGNSVVTDMWEYIDSDRYKFTVGLYENGEWKQIYLSTQFVQVKNK